jgi:sugar lactone lactonase YvrE
MDNTGTVVIGTANLSGIGTGPAIAFPTTMPFQVVSGLSLSGSFAVDGFGNVYAGQYLGDSNQNTSIIEFIADQGVVTASSATRLIGSGFYLPYGLAIDGAGNLFVADTYHHAIKEIMAVAGTIPDSPTIRTLGSGFQYPYSLAVDRSGNVFVADNYSSLVSEIVAVDGTIPTSPTIRTLGSGFQYPEGIAVDPSGDVFVADSANHLIKEIVAVAGSIPASNPTIRSLGSGYSIPRGLQLDAAGDLFVADRGNGTVKELLAVSGVIPASNPTTLTIASGLYAPRGLALDASGNLFTGPVGNGGAAITEISLGGPPTLIFQSTPVDTVSTDSPMTFQLENIGNATLTISGGGPTVNFAVDDNTTTCDSSTPIAPSGLCTVGVDFTPFVAGSISGTVSITDNTLNTPGSSQYVKLSGASTGTPTLIPFSITAANVTVVAGATPTLTIQQLAASISTPTITQTQLQAIFSNAEVGFTVTGPGFSYNIPLASYGTTYASNLVPAVPADAPLGTFKLTPYISGPNAALFNFAATAGSITIASSAPAPTQLLNITAAHVAVVAGATPSQYVAQLMASYTAPGLSGTQLAAMFSNAEVGFTVAGPGFSYNIPLYSYGTYYGANLLSAVPSSAPTGTFTLTPYLIGPGAATFYFSETPGTLTITAPGTQLLSITAANITVHAGATPTQYVSQLMASYSAPGLTGIQLAAKFANCEVGFTVTGPGFSYNIPLYSYGTYYGANFLQQVPSTAPLGTFTLTPYITGSGTSAFAFNPTAGTLTIATP